MEHLRIQFIAELAKLNLGTETTKQVLAAFDVASTGYEVRPQEVSIIQYDTTPELVKVYIAVKAVEGLAHGTLYGYRHDLEKFFAEVSCPVEQITANMIRSYLFAYQQMHHVQLSRVNKIRQTLSGFFSWATNEGYLERNPMKPINPIKDSQKQRKSLTREQLEEMRRACVTTQERAILDVLYATGCRVSELCNMKIGDLDLTTMQGQVLGKGSKYRTIYLNASAKLSIKAYLRERVDDTPYLIVSTRAPYHGISREAVFKIVKRIASRCGLTWVGPHIIRHTSATMALRTGMKIQDVQKMLGHSNIATTMIYLDIDPEGVRYEHLRCVV